MPNVHTGDSRDQYQDHTSHQEVAHDPYYYGMFDSPHDESENQSGLFHDSRPASDS